MVPDDQKKLTSRDIVCCCLAAADIVLLFARNLVVALSIIALVVLPGYSITGAILFFCVAIPGIIVLHASFRAARRSVNRMADEDWGEVRDQQCPRCRYDVRVTLARRDHSCPECGQHLSIKHLGLGPRGGPATPSSGRQTPENPRPRRLSCIAPSADPEIRLGARPRAG